MPGDDPYKNFNFKVNLDGESPPPPPPPPPKKESGSGTTKRTGGFLDKLRNLLGFSRR